MLSTSHALAWTIMLLPNSRVRISPSHNIPSGVAGRRGDAVLCAQCRLRCSRRRGHPHDDLAGWVARLRWGSVRVWRPPPSLLLENLSSCFWNKWTLCTHLMWRHISSPCPANSLCHMCDSTRIDSPPRSIEQRRRGEVQGFRVQGFSPYPKALPFPPLPADRSLIILFNVAFRELLPSSASHTPSTLTQEEIPLLSHGQ